MDRYKDPQMGETDAPGVLVPDYPNIQLNNLEIEIGSIIAKKRNSNNKNLGVKPNLVISDEEKADREGLLSELAFCRIARVYPHEVFRLGYTSKKFGGDKGDAFIGDVSIDVKSTTYLNGKLIAMVDNELIDYFALMVGENGAYTLKGLMPRSELCVEKRFGHHQIFRRPCFMARQDELLSWTQFLKKENIDV